MKKIFFPVTSFFVVLSYVIQMNSCKGIHDKNDYLRNVLADLEKIKSATYLSTMSGNPPGDTTVLKTYLWHKKEYINPSDTTIGSVFAWFYPDDTSKMYLYYDGSAQAYLDNDKKTISIDSFQTNTLPFRPISSPFFNRAKNIIKYALETKDSISAELKEFGDSIRFILYIPYRVVYFFGKPFAMDNPYLSKENAFCKYEIWINKSDNLPYKIINKTPYTTDLETCKNVELNKIKIEDFIAAEYFPSDYEIKVRGKEQTIKKDLTGKIAPDWILIDYSNRSIALKDLKYKVLIIEFTGIGCAPCHAAIPLIKQFVTDNKDKDFRFISIETWGSDIDGLKRYHKNNELNYTLLKGEEETTKSYQINGVPSFFIIDKDRVIRKIIRGYEDGTTDKELRDAINKLI
jgi:thiol-disulfide isomerase/thioredoxin